MSPPTEAASGTFGKFVILQGMGSKAEEFSKRAAEADEKAEKANDTEARQAYREVAKHWRTMAAQAERLGW